MMRHIQLSVSKLALCIAALSMSSCKIDRCKEPEPEIEFDSYRYKPANPEDPTTSDTLFVKTSFVDCQGDIGLKSSDEGYNLRTYLYEQIGGEWIKFVPLNPADSLALFARIPFSSKVKEGTKAEGFIEQKLGSIKQTSDTIRFETYIFDREGHKSNRITTPTYVLPN